MNVNALGETASECRGRAQRRRVKSQDVPGAHTAYEWRFVCTCGHSSSWMLNGSLDMVRTMYTNHRRRLKEGYRG